MKRFHFVSFNFNLRLARHGQQGAAICWPTENARRTVHRCASSKARRCFRVPNGNGSHTKEIAKEEDDHQAAVLGRIEVSEELTTVSALLPFVSRLIQFIYTLYAKWPPHSLGVYL